MSFETERTLIETELKAGADAAGIPVQYPNTPFQPNAAVGFVRLTILGGQGSLGAIVGTASPTRFPGVIDLAIFRPRNAGGKPTRAWADTLAAALTNKSLASGSVRIVTFSARLEDLGEVGDWNQANLSIPFVRDVN